jgi:hypothetical protein
MNHCITLDMVMLVALAGVSSAAEEKVPNIQKAPVQLEGYASPMEAYNAHREALKNRDWPTVFHSTAPGDRMGLFFPGFDACILCDKLKEQDAHAILKKYRIDRDEMMRQYEKKYLEIYGIDLAKLQADYQKKCEEYEEKYRAQHGVDLFPWKKIPQLTPKGPYTLPRDYPQFTPPPPDEQLLTYLAYQLLNDKEGFVVEVSKLVFDSENSLPRLGNLEQLKIAGDKARGSYNQTVGITRYTSFDREGKKTDYYQTRKTIHFRRINGRWFVGEYTEEDFQKKWTEEIEKKRPHKPTSGASHQGPS